MSPGEVRFCDARCDYPKLLFLILFRRAKEKFLFNVRKALCSYRGVDYARHFVYVTIDGFIGAHQLYLMT